MAAVAARREDGRRAARGAAGIPTRAARVRGASWLPPRIRPADRRAATRGLVVRRSGRQQGRPDARCCSRCAQGNTEAVSALLKAGADINQVSAGDHTSPLLMATINGQFDLAKVLLERGANPKLASDAGATPLYATINVQWAAKSLYPQPTAQTAAADDVSRAHGGAAQGRRRSERAAHEAPLVHVVQLRPARREHHGRDAVLARGVRHRRRRDEAAGGVRRGSQDSHAQARRPTARRRRAGRGGRSGEGSVRAARRFRPAGPASFRFTPRRASGTAKATRPTRTSTRPTAGCRR